MGIKFFLLLLLYTFLSIAEYRVFQLKIYKEIPLKDSRSPQSTTAFEETDVVTVDSAEEGETSKALNEELVKLVLSNLDPEQYVGYYPLQKDEKIKYIDTWMCKGRTNGKEFCENPRLKPEEPSPETLNTK